MKSKILALLLFSFGVMYWPYTMANNPKAAKEAVVWIGKEVRITVLTPGMVRLEWSPKGQFTDAASFVVVNRQLAVPDYTVTEENGWIVISTDKMNIRYQKGSGRFTQENLHIRASRKSTFQFEWKPGDQQTGNLKGTYRTLDEYEGNTHKNGSPMPLEEGLLARDGWTLIDDSKSLLFDNSEWAWVKERSKEESKQDWYFLAYGTDYKTALYDYMQIGGRVPMPPRYAFGYWWSRYWDYSDRELKTLVENFESYDIPLDVLVVDMGWHRTDSLYSKRLDEFGLRQHWTGWTWNKSLFPDPEAFLKWTASRNLQVTLNLHPASGIAPYEAVYTEFAKRMNFDTTSGSNIPFEASNKQFMTTLFDIVLHPKQHEGVDFWWLDWQQWPFDRQIPTLSNTWWLNYLFFSDMERNGTTRPLLFHRWGGLGNHRYQIGFSGDSYISWKSLAFQPYFTNCASNVLYGYWSHDIGGHMFKPNEKKYLDPELYTRWLQYGVFSPILRTHSGKDTSLNKEAWNFERKYFSIQKDAIQWRYNLVPYIYTAARECYDTGVSICRPLYYEDPDCAESYEFPNEFFFGNDLLVAPICSPSKEGISTLEVWLPKNNNWFEWHTGTLLKGGQCLTRRFSLDQYPVYVRAGAIIPMSDNIKNLSEQSSLIRLAIFPGADGSALLYEDQGNDKHYVSEYAVTTFSTHRTGNRMLVKIGPRKGNYETMPMRRRYQLEFYGSGIPASITCGNQELEYRYDGDRLCLIVELAETSPDQSQEIVLVYPENLPEINDGLAGLFRRLSRATSTLKYREPRMILPDVVGEAEEISVMLSYHPQLFSNLVTRFRLCYDAIPQAVMQMNIQEKNKLWYLKELGFEQINRKK